MEYYYKNDFSLLKRYIEYNQGSYFDLYKFQRRLWESIEKNTYGKFLDDFILQEKTRESEYFITPQQFSFLGVNNGKNK